MLSEPDRIAGFLGRTGWGGAKRVSLAGDASNRRYERLSDGEKTAVLMIAPPETGEDIEPFTLVAEHLGAVGLSAPEILAGEATAGLLLIEDLGDDLYARVADDQPGLEPEIYRAAVDVLVYLHDQPAPSWAKPYDAHRLINLAGLAFEWYADSHFPVAVQTELRRLFGDTRELTDVLVLRDYHAENLLWLPQRDGIARTGLLDFQDAMAGHRAYDLVSLVEDARRDLVPDLGGSLVDHYLTRTGLPADEFRRAFALLGAQRNLRILGVFARLAIRDGKPGYLGLVPRVWGNLLNDLAHPTLARLSELVLSELPQPDAEQINRLTARCTQTP